MVFQMVPFFKLHPLHPLGVNRLIEFSREKCKGCHIFKTYLRRAFCQIPVYLTDIPLGFEVNDLLYFHVILPFSLRSAVLICQCTTKAVIFIPTKDNNVLVDVYIETFLQLPWLKRHCLLMINSCFCCKSLAYKYHQKNDFTLQLV